VRLHLLVGDEKKGPISEGFVGEFMLNLGSSHYKDAYVVVRNHRRFWEI
jgi:hypothetical protein